MKITITLTISPNEQAESDFTIYELEDAIKADFQNCIDLADHFDVKGEPTYSVEE